MIQNAFDVFMSVEVSSRFGISSYKLIIIYFMNSHESACTTMVLKFVLKAGFRILTSAEGPLTLRLYFVSPKYQLEGAMY